MAGRMLGLGLGLSATFFDLGLACRSFGFSLATQLTGLN